MAKLTEEMNIIIPQILVKEIFLNAIFFSQKIIIIFEPYTMIFSFGSFFTHLSYQFKQFISMAGIEYLQCKYNLGVIYEILSFTFNFRLRLKLFINDVTEVFTLSKVYPCCS